MSMIKKLMAAVAVALAVCVVTPASSDGAVFVRRVAPVRRVAARAVLPPYPVARRAVVGPVYRPVYRPYVGGYYGGFYGGGVAVPGVSVWW